MDEIKMREKGVEKVWKAVYKNSGDFKAISSTQLGQQLIFEDCLTMLPSIMDWINNSCAKSYRKNLKDYFSNEEIVLQRTVEVFFLLTGSMLEHGSKIRPRHKNVEVIRRKLMPELSFELVWRFIEVVVDNSQYLDVESNLLITGGGYNNYIKYTCNISEEIMNKLSLDAAQAFYPLPMNEIPLDWKVDEESNIVGGYKTYQYDLIRSGFQTNDLDYSEYPKETFDAVNYIQRVPWVVNKEMALIVDRDLQMPRKEDFIKSEYPDPVEGLWDEDLRDENCKLSPTEIASIEKKRKEFSEMSELYNAEKGDFESALGKYRAVKLAVGVAFNNFDQTIYFPHSYDFRGRIYPLAVGLSPQGSDAVKSMLEYEKGEVLTPEGEAWAWAYLASLFGDDKICFEERIARGKELLHQDYMEADEPYQFLAHQQELKRFTADPNYLFKGRVHLDACNSGSQFTSAITGDRAGCLATNVIPTINIDGTQDRQDAYLLVANKALELCLTRIESATTSEEILMFRFFKKLLEEDGRKVCKKPVMVSNYGGTTGGRTEILWNLMREMGVERKWITKKVASQFSSLIGDSIQGVLIGGKAFEVYIHKMNNLIAKQDVSVKWTTSDGFKVTHSKKKELKPKRVSCMLPGSRRNTTILKKVFSDKVSVAKMKSAIAPNYIHSLDAELLRRTALKMRDAGIMDSDWIHDSFGCHPNHVDTMLDITKDEFKKQMRGRRCEDGLRLPPLKKLNNELMEQIKESDREKAPAYPQLRGFDVRAGGLNVVMDSNWFFS